jgi:hypothetical protein
MRGGQNKNVLGGTNKFLHAVLKPCPILNLDIFHLRKLIKLKICFK